MSLSATNLHPLFGVRVTGIDMRGTPDAATLGEFIDLMDRFAVCAVSHDTPLTNAQHIAFAGHLGPMERGSTPKIAGTGSRVPHTEIIDQSNLDQDGKIYDDDDRRMMFKRANRLWHTDMSFYAVRATRSLLSAYIVPPEEGNTEFVDTRSVYDALPEAMKKRIAGLAAEHCYWHSRALGGGPEPTEEERAARPPARHKLVHTHPGSGRTALYLASHIKGITGWPEDEAQDLIAELMNFATGPEFVFSYKWQAGDVVTWDNLCTLHRATPFDDMRYKRDMRRATCREVLN
jgi:alpha-ketoglutarate-dependent 2,4-dichlorophenoxyacetate dioxygenase